MTTNAGPVGRPDGPDTCFVVMPFGQKPIPDGSGRLYDFDKVYRVVHQRAIRQAGLEPVRADEMSGSHMIHADMFRGLRDARVVLADLSLANPNVYYELGIRHVMASRGTVLTCVTGAELPFDVRLSRVLFYDYDGQYLDWEEAERVVDELQRALEDLSRQEPDSPVHAMLEQVLPDEELARYTTVAVASGGAADVTEPLDHYQEMIARQWAAEGADVGALLESAGTSAFGCRALGHLCLLSDPPPLEALPVAGRLVDVGQYDLANRIYERLSGRLGFGDLLRYASSVSEEPTEPGAAQTAATQGITLAGRALDLVLPALEDEPPPVDALRAAFLAHHRLAGLLAWRRELTDEDADLEAAVHELQEADAAGRRLVATGSFDQWGRLAQVRLRLLLLLRILDGGRDRPDSERLADAILDLDPGPVPHSTEVSYLRWYQAITRADVGDLDRSLQVAVQAFADDETIMHRPGAEQIGRTQYRLLRRFVDHYTAVFRHPILVGRVCQVLQYHHSHTPDPSRARSRTAL